jgi:hypothetical protein
VADRVELGGHAFLVREMAPGDRKAIVNTWFPSARDVRNVPVSVFHRHYPAVIAACLDGARTVVLYREAAPETVHAWACGEGPDLLHWAYVPRPLRGVGMGRAAIRAALGGYPDRVHVSSPFKPRTHPRFLFNPFRRRGPP